MNLSSGQNGSASIQERFEWQCRAFLLACLVAAVLCGWFALSCRQKAEDTPLVLETRINPNTAPAASLMRLPGVGPAIAEAIVGFRETAMAGGGGQPFNSVKDMQRVKGIGPKTSERMGESILFEEGGL